MSTDSMIFTRYVQVDHMSDFFLANQKIGGCIISILLITSLWHGIECNSINRNEGNQLNRGEKNSKQLFNHNFDPLLVVLNHTDDNRNSSRDHSMPISTNTSAIPLSSSSLNTLDLNYVLSLLHEERQTHTQTHTQTTGNSDKLPQPQRTTPSLIAQHQQKDAIVKDSEIVLGVEDKRGLQEANKLSLYSSSLNVIDDGSPEDTQLAHNILLIHRPKLNRTAKPTFRPPPIYFSKHKPSTTTSTIVPVFEIKTTSTTQSYPTPVNNNHRPMNHRPWKTKPPITTILTTISPQQSTTIPSKFETTETTLSKTTDTVFPKTSPVFEDESPVLFKNNHKRPAFSAFTRQKLSTEYALYFTTPIGSSTSTSSVEPPYEEPLTSTVTVPSYTTTSMVPSHVTPINHLSSSIVSVVKRPPIKINHVQANRIKHPEAIHSHEMTVLDPPFGHGIAMRLPPNTTILHKNVIVPIRPGRPNPLLTTTTQFPIYPVVAGITNWQSQTTTPAYQWHPHKPTIPWTYPTMTTIPPPTTSNTLQPQTIIDSIGTESAEVPIYEHVTAQTAQRPTFIPINTQTIPIVTHAIPFRPQPQRQTSQSAHIVTVTPIKPSSAPTPNTFLVTQAHTPRPSTSTTTEYVNAIWAPPMPSPVNTGVRPPSQTGGWFWPFSNLFAVDSSSGIFSFFAIMKTVLFTVLVMFLPPLTLAAALMQAAAG